MSSTAPFIDLNEMIAEKYEQMGTDKTTALFPGDHTHTSPDGAKLNAQTVVEGIKGLKDWRLRRFCFPSHDRGLARPHPLFPNACQRETARAAVIG